jgi:hypothetical protein
MSLQIDNHRWNLETDQPVIGAGAAGPAMVFAAWRAAMDIAGTLDRTPSGTLQ